MALAYKAMTKLGKEKSKEVIEMFVVEIGEAISTEALVEQISTDSSTIRFAGRDVIVLKEVTTKLNQTSTTGTGMVYLTVIDKFGQRETFWESRKSGFDNEKIVELAVKSMADLYVQRQKDLAIEKAQKEAVEIMRNHLQVLGSEKPKKGIVNYIELVRSWALVEEEVIPAIMVSLTVSAQQLGLFLDAAKQYSLEKPEEEL